VLVGLKKNNNNNNNNASGRVFLSKLGRKLADQSGDDREHTHSQRMNRLSTNRPSFAAAQSSRDADARDQ